jgi:hypothetical protein
MFSVFLSSDTAKEAGMKRKRWFILLCLLVLLALAIVPVLAETNATYDLSWWTVDSGGVTGSTSGNYTLSGTAGQPDAGSLSFGDYDLAGGFWQALLEKLEVFLPLIKN